MSEKRFTLTDWHEVKDNGRIMTVDEVINMLNEQQATISQLEKNFDDLVKWASEIAKRNVILDEQIGQLQRENEQLRKELDILKSSSAENQKVVR